MTRLLWFALPLLALMACASPRATATVGPVTVILDAPQVIAEACAAMAGEPDAGGCVAIVMLRQKTIDAVIFCPSWPLRELVECMAHEAAHLIGWRHD